jgi:hypothetical protein
MPLPITWNRQEGCSKLAEKIVPQVQFGIGQIDQLLETYTDLLEQARKSTPDLVEVTALGSVLHSFYNGLENIFLSIAKGLDAQVPTGAHWHRDLLTQMAEPTPGRRPVLTPEMVSRLADYLGFRHFYRHSYSFHLEWDELKKLVMSLAEVWEHSRGEIQAFLEGLSLDDI